MNHTAEATALSARSVRQRSIRQYRSALGLSQATFAELLGVGVETYRTWDSGRRTPTPGILAAARALATAGRHVPVPLAVLAEEFDVHVRTLRRAAHDGRLTAVFDTRTYFGHVIARATRTATAEFVRDRQGQSASKLGCQAATLKPPVDCASSIIELRLRLRLTQTALAKRIGAASKAVIYQWESQKRKPSPLFWARLSRLRAGSRCRR